MIHVTCLKIVSNLGRTGHGTQQTKLSWFPLAHTYEGSGENVGRWTDHLNDMYEGRVKSITKGDSSRGFHTPLSPAKWRDRLRGYPVGRRAYKQLEHWAEEFLNVHVDNR